MHCKEVHSWFSGLGSIKEVIIGDEVTLISGSAFKDCSGLTSVTIPNSVTSIGSSAFEGCSSLKSVTIGNSVTSIGDYAFIYCSFLMSIVCWATVPPSCVYTTFPPFLTQSCKLSVPKGCIDAYKSANWWKNFLTIVETDPNTLGIEKLSPDSEKEEVARYGIDGTKLNKPNRGINIIRTNDGRTRKVYLK